MAKTITFLTSNSVNNVDTNFQRVNTALEDVLSLSGELPNSMEADLDMNSNDVLNAGELNATSLRLNGTAITASGDLAPIGAGTIGTTELADGSVTEPKHATGGVSTRALADGVVTKPKLATSLTTDLQFTVANRTELKSVDVARTLLVYLSEAGREGVFEFDSSDLSATLVVSSVTSTSVNDTTEVITKAAHGLLTGHAVVVTAAVNGLSTDTLYYVIRVDKDTLKLATSFANARAGTAVNLTGTTNVTLERLLDPVEAVYVIPNGSAKNGSQGAFVRQFDGSVDALWAGPDTTGATASDEAFQGIFTLMHEFTTLFSGRDHTFLIDGPVYIDASNFTWHGGALFKKGSGLNVMFYAWDATDYVTVRDLRFDGGRSGFVPQNPISPFLGYTNIGWVFENNEFFNLADAGVVWRNSFKTTFRGNSFHDSWESGVEARWYDDDPRTAAEWDYQPDDYGELIFDGNHCEALGRMEDAGTGLVNGCGVTFDANAGVDRQVHGVVVANNTFIDCLRSIFCENNDPSTPIYSVSITGNTIDGVAATPVADTYETRSVKMGIGLINVAEFNITGNTIRNIGNHDPFDSDTAGIVLSSSTRDGVVASNTIIDDRGGIGDVMDYGIQVTSATRVTIVNNSVGGASTAQINIAASLDDIVCRGNLGAEGSYSWGNIITIPFQKSDINASVTNNPFFRGGLADVDNVIMPARCTVVATAVKLSAVVSGGTFSIRPRIDGSDVTALELANADVATTTGYKEISTQNGSVCPQGGLLSVVVTTDGSFTPSGSIDAVVDLYVDVGGK